MGFTQIQLHPKQVTAVNHSEGLLAFVGGLGCFTPDTLILTNEGHRPISEIQKGDFVLSKNLLTLQDEYKQVVEKYRWDKCGLIIKLQLKNGEINCTPNHELYTSTGWVSAGEFARGIMEGRSQYRGQVQDQQFRQADNFRLEGEIINPGNETSKRRKRILPYNDQVQWKDRNYKNTSVGSASVGSESIKQTLCESYQFRAIGQQFTEPRMGYNERERKPLIQCRENYQSQRIETWQRNIYGGDCKGNEIEIYPTQIHLNNDCEGIRGKSENGKGNCTEAKGLLGSRIIHESDILGVEYYNYEGFVYDLCVEDNSNYTVTEDNYLVHNSGKTVSGAHWALKQIWTAPKDAGLIFTNTNKQLTTATLHVFMDVLAFYGFHRDHQYVIDKNPEPYFKYKSTFPKHDGVWSFYNGAQVVTFSLESMMRGITVSWVWGDEIQDATKDQLNIVLGRAREKGSPTRVLYTLTPPRQNPDIDEMIFGENAIPKVVATTYDNRDNLNEGYIEMLEKMYDPLTFQREVMGQRVETSGKAYAYAFEKGRHVSDQAVYDPRKMLILDFDFNVDPFVCLAIQHGTREGGHYIHFVDEVSLPDSNLSQMCEVLRSRFPEALNAKSIEITGDPAGRSRNIYDPARRNAFQIILDGLGLGPGYLHIPNVTRNADDRVLFNSILARHPQMIINPKCRTFIRDLQFVRVDNYGEIIKRNRKDDTQQADLLDAAKYYFQAYHSDFIFRRAYAPPEPVIKPRKYIPLKGFEIRK